MMAIRVYPGTETPRLMSRTSNVRKPEWDLVCGNHQGQRQLPRDQQAGHKTVPDQGMPNRQKALATQEPSTQDIGGCYDFGLTANATTIRYWFESKDLLVLLRGLFKSKSIHERLGSTDF